VQTQSYQPEVALDVHSVLLGISTICTDTLHCTTVNLQTVVVTSVQIKI